jgi:hypothetical protein
MVVREASGSAISREDRVRAEHLCLVPFSFQSSVLRIDSRSNKGERLAVVCSSTVEVARPWALPVHRKRVEQGRELLMDHGLMGSRLKP